MHACRSRHLCAGGCAGPQAKDHAYIAARGEEELAGMEDEFNDDRALEKYRQATQ